MPSYVEMQRGSEQWAERRAVRLCLSKEDVVNGRVEDIEHQLKQSVEDISLTAGCLWEKVEITLTFKEEGVSS